jgi:hypothetical protein
VSLGRTFPPSAFPARATYRSRSLRGPLGSCRQRMRSYPSLASKEAREQYGVRRREPRPGTVGASGRKAAANRRSQGAGGHRRTCNTQGLGRSIAVPPRPATWSPDITKGRHGDRFRLRDDDGHVIEVWLLLQLVRAQLYIGRGYRALLFRPTLSRPLECACTRFSGMVLNKLAIHMILI